MAKKQLFKGVVEALHEGSYTTSEMSDQVGTTVRSIEDELGRLKQCGAFSQWILYNSGSKEYKFNSHIKKCPIDSVIYMIKYFHKRQKNFDDHMGANRKEMPQNDMMEQLDKFITEVQ